MTRQAVRRLSDRAVPFGWGLAAILPLVGLTSLLLRSHLDPNFTNPRLHFVLFMIVGGLASMLAYAAGNAADRRGTLGCCCCRSRSWRPACSCCCMR